MEQRRATAFLESREAGMAIVGLALEGGVTVTSLTAAAENTASFADDAIRLVQERLLPAVECRPGCSYCCRKPGVLVTLPELLRVLEHVRTTFTVSQTVDLRTRATQYADQIAGHHFNDPLSGSVPCPLLVDERCSVYEVRPLVCRGFNSMSAEACRRAHDSVQYLIPIFALLKDVTDGATVGIAHRLKELGMRNSVVDLGSALHTALSAGQPDLDSLLADERVLESVEDPDWVDALWDRFRDVNRGAT
jgi:Fe-S-cluster containining protein